MEICFEYVYIGFFFFFTFSSDPLRPAAPVCREVCRLWRTLYCTLVSPGGLTYHGPTVHSFASLRRSKKFNGLSKRENQKQKTPYNRLLLFIFIVQFVRVCNLSTVITSKITKNKAKTKQNRINCAWPSYGNPTMLNKSPSMPRAIVAHDVLFTSPTEPFQRTNPPLHQSKVVSTDESKPWPRSECDEGLI